LRSERARRHRGLLADGSRDRDPLDRQLQHHNN
jgi:hypothetical protein